MPGLEWNENELAILADMYTKGRPVAEIVDAIKAGAGRSRSVAAIQVKAQALRIRHGSAIGTAGFTVHAPKSAGRTFEELLADRVKEHSRKTERFETKRSGIDIDIDGSGPYAIAFVGDPHVDDPGTSLAKLHGHLEAIKGARDCYAINMGDLTNNWIGTLSRLYAHQTFTDKEGITIAKWMLGAAPWLAVILGNHDKWTGVAEELCQSAGVKHVSHGAVFKVNRNGHTVKIDARHTHGGNSQYNPAFAQGKQNYRGSDCDIIIGAHTHQSAYTLLKNGITQKVGHCIRVGSYKEADEYAEVKNFPEQTISPVVLATVDHRSDHPRIQIWHDLELGLEYLKMLQCA